jgi:hypothetical protein
MQEIVEIRPWLTDFPVEVGGWWEVEIRSPSGKLWRRLKDTRECPDELSVYLTVTKELEERTHGRE